MLTSLFLLLFWPPVPTAVLLLFLAEIAGGFCLAQEESPGITAGSSPLCWPARVLLPSNPSLSLRRHKPSCPDQRARCGRHDLSQRLLGARLRRWIRADFLSLVRPSVSHPGMLCSLLLFLPSRPELRAVAGRGEEGGEGSVPGSVPVGIAGLSSRLVPWRGGGVVGSRSSPVSSPSTTVCPSRFCSAYGAKEALCIRVTLPLASHFKINCL